MPSIIKLQKIFCLARILNITLQSWKWNFAKQLNLHTKNVAMLMLERDSEQFVDQLYLISAVSWFHKLYKLHVFFGPLCITSPIGSSCSTGLILFCVSWIHAFNGLCVFYLFGVLCFPVF